MNLIQLLSWLRPLIVILLAVVFLAACSVEPPRCGSVRSRCYTVKDINSYILDLRKNSVTDSSFNFYDSLRIAFYISETGSIDAESHNKSVFFRKYSFPIFSGSPVSKEPTLVQKIDSIRITSGGTIFSDLGKFDPGEPLNNLFLLNGLSMHDFVVRHSSYPQSGVDRTCSLCFNKYTISYLSLIQKPLQPINQTLYINLIFDDGNSIGFETPILKVQ
ncbi:MAG: hypothetical protein ABJ004_19690 [Cyclobacteriaceae bacterium]